MDIDYEKTFGFRPESIGNRYRHHWVITEPDEDDERAGAKAGCLCVRARDGASNPVDAEACKHPNFIGTVEDDFDHTFRYYYYRTLTDADREDPAATITALRKRVEELERDCGALVNACHEEFERDAKYEAILGPAGKDEDAIDVELMLYTNFLTYGHIRRARATLKGETS